MGHSHGGRAALYFQVQYNNQNGRGALVSGGRAKRQVRLYRQATAKQQQQQQQQQQAAQRAGCHVRARPSPALLFSSRARSEAVDTSEIRLATGKQSRQNLGVLHNTYHTYE